MNSSQFIAQYLYEDERILYNTKCSTATFFFPIVFIIIGFCIGWIGVIIWIPSAIWFLIKILNYFFCEFTITNKRIIIQYGYFSRNVSEININKVERIDVRQGFIGRILDYGAINIRGVGIGNVWHRGVNEPITFEKSLYAVINNE